MFIKYAFLTKDGTPKYITASAVDGEYFDGKVVDDLIAQSIPEDVDATEILENWYWNGKWIKKPKKESEFHMWNATGKLWQLDEDSLIIASKGKRNIMLQQSDWTQLPDVSLTEDQKNAWRKYRESLRNMTNEDYLNGNFPKVDDKIK